jgi:NifU-like protein involved in Fe-S cluster formation
MTQFSETLMDHFQSPRHQGRMADSDCVGTAGIPGQGRFIQFFLRIANGRVERMQFHSFGCGVTIAVCSVMTELTERRTKAECAAIRVEDVIAALDGIPPHKQDCAHMGVAALQHAMQGWPQREQSGALSESAAN